MDSRFLPANMVRLISEKDRKALGIQTGDERMKKWKVKSERDLQRQIVNYLKLRGIEVCWHRTDKKSAATIGWPDITFAVRVNGFPSPCAYEVKFGSGTLSREQNDVLARMQAPPNCWRIRVIRTFIEVVDDMRELGL